MPSLLCYEFRNWLASAAKDDECPLNLSDHALDCEGCSEFTLEYLTKAPSELQQEVNRLVLSLGQSTLATLSGYACDDDEYGPS